MFSNFHFNRMSKKKNVYRLRDLSETEQDPQFLRCCVEMVNSWGLLSDMARGRSQSVHIGLLFSEPEGTGQSGGSGMALKIPGLSKAIELALATELHHHESVHVLWPFMLQQKPSQIFMVGKK